MVARAALIKPWIFAEATAGYRDISADDRVAIYRRYAALAREHWGADEYGLARVRTFVKWHLDFWSRYVPQLPDGSFPAMQRRAAAMSGRTPLEALLARSDEAAWDYLADRLTLDQAIDPSDAPAPAAPSSTADDDRRAVAMADAIEVEG
jgi:tRNA-dihydrouridine synthase 3